MSENLLDGFRLKSVYDSVSVQEYVEITPVLDMLQAPVTAFRRPQTSLFRYPLVLAGNGIFGGSGLQSRFRAWNPLLQGSH